MHERVSQKQKLDKYVFEEVTEKKGQWYWCLGNSASMKLERKKINGTFSLW